MTRRRSSADPEVGGASPSDWRLFAVALFLTLDALQIVALMRD
jgi:hypothetical protein